MDWRQAMEGERAALMRVVALLHALAGLGELAVNRSAAVRGFVLWVLRHAEEMVQDFVDPAPEFEVLAMPLSLHAGSPDVSHHEAMRLAASLRALARCLEAEIAWIDALGRDGRRRSDPRLSRRTVCPAAIGSIAARLSRLGALSRLTISPAGAPDTS